MVYSRKKTKNKKTQMKTKSRGKVQRRKAFKDSESVEII